MILTLDDAPGTVDPEPFAGPDHPMRKLTRRVAFDGAWDLERAHKVADLFDSMAAEWASRADDLRSASVHDALRRGDAPLVGQWLELGAGTGAGTAVLHDQGIRVVALDIAAQMLGHADASLAPQIRADSASLPIRDQSVDAILCVNMLLFPNEVDRVLRPSGTLVWVNSLGDQTPIHLSTAEVLAALPGDWSATTARAGSGFWATVRRR
ncbi:MAG: class I SAM-dependent methyltransferase [Acidimicrobiales bacterium]